MSLVMESLGNFDPSQGSLHHVVVIRVSIVLPDGHAVKCAFDLKKAFALITIYWWCAILEIVTKAAFGQLHFSAFKQPTPEMCSQGRIGDIASRRYINFILTIYVRFFYFC